MQSTAATMEELEPMGFTSLDPRPAADSIDGGLTAHIQLAAFGLGHVFPSRLFGGESRPRPDHGPFGPDLAGPGRLETIIFSADSFDVFTAPQAPDFPIYSSLGEPEVDAGGPFGPDAPGAPVRDMAPRLTTTSLQDPWHTLGQDDLDLAAAEELLDIFRSRLGFSLQNDTLPSLDTLSPLDAFRFPGGLRFQDTLFARFDDLDDDEREIEFFPEDFVDPPTDPPAPPPAVPADVVITGTPLGDILVGGAENSAIFGLAGDDCLMGNGGVDIIFGEDGNDTLNGGDGDDCLFGGNGDDRLQWSAGLDTIDGGAGSDAVDFSPSPVAVIFSLIAATGAAVANVLVSNIENIIGSIFADLLDGDAQANYIDGGAGDDTLTGQAGDDTLRGDAGADCLLGGDGLDLADYSTAPSAVLANLAAGLIGGGHGADSLQDIEGAVGSAFSDTMLGDGAANVFFGEAGNDSIQAMAGNDTVAAGDGNDTVSADAGDDSLSGGAGIDLLDFSAFTAAFFIHLTAETVAGAGADTVQGFEFLRTGAMNDTLVGDAADNTLIAGAGDDSVLGGDGDDSMNGGQGDDVFNGGAGSDTLSYADIAGGVAINIAAGTVTGAGGNDMFSNIEHIIGTAQGDTLIGWIGADTLQGGLGDDSIDGGGGQDFASYEDAASAVTVDLPSGGVTGGGGNDTLDGIEHIIGSPFNDTLSGNAVDNIIFAVAGNDSVLGGQGADTLDGGAGNDSLFGNQGADSVAGGDGDDTLFGNEDNDTLVGGAGSDWVHFGAATAAVEVNLTTATAVGPDGSDSISGVENALGGGFNDTLTGDAAGNVLDGAGGDDTLVGLGGGDSLIGGAGNDFLDGGDGNDTIDAGNASDSVDAGDGDDSIVGGGGADTIVAGAGNDVVGGGGGIDSIIAGDGDDTVGGGNGVDVLDGGNGNDWLDYTDTSNSVILDLAAGTIVTASGNDIISSFENIVTRIGDDSLFGDAGDNSLVAWGGDDTLSDGSAGDDYLDGGNNNDWATYVQATAGVIVDLNIIAPQNTIGSGIDQFRLIENLIGSNFNDTLIGEQGVNILIGGDGDDSLAGRAGADQLTGGAGNDVFVFFESADGMDTITDFSSANDDIRFINSTFAWGIAAAVDGSTFFDKDDVVGGYAGVIGVAGPALIFDDNNILWYDQDGLTAGNEQQLATIVGDDAAAADIDFI